MRDVTVVGAGVSGLSFAQMASSFYHVNVLEAASDVGGLIKCSFVNGNLFHRVGGHVFNSKNKDVLTWFWQHFDRDKEFLFHERRAKILLGGSLIGYPIEDHLYELPENTASDIINELLLTLRRNKSLSKEQKSFKDFLIDLFGPTLYELYFGPYNTKLWRRDIGSIPVDWLEGKLPMPKPDEIFLNNILRRKEQAMVHAGFYYPRHNGSQFIANRLKEGLPVHLSTPLEEIVVLPKNRLMLNGGKYESDLLVYCGDVRKLATLLRSPSPEVSEALRAVQDFESIGISTVFCQTEANELSWLYLPEPDVAAHRIIYTGNFSDENNADLSRKTCVVEFSGFWKYDEAVVEVSKLPGNVKPISFHYEPNAYVVQRSDTRSKISRLKDALATYGIHLLGRFAEWEYYNMDKCIESAMALLEQLQKTPGPSLDTASRQPTS